MKPFDLEAAKAGKPFARKDFVKAVKAYQFVGVRLNGSIVFEIEYIDGNHKDISWAPQSALQMLPEKVFRVTWQRSKNGLARGQVSVTKHTADFSNLKDATAYMIFMDADDHAIIETEV